MTIWPLVVVLLPAACSRPAASHNDKTIESGHPAPFQASEAAETSQDSTAVQQDSAAKSNPGLPFTDSQGLPAGTLLTVRLRNPVSAGNATTNRPFDAEVDEPILIAGSTMLPRGARVEGRVESARASRMKKDQGYVRLTLDSIDVDGQALPIQTASLFVRGSAAENQAVEGKGSPQIVRLQGGRRLTFRLSGAVSITGQSSIPAR